MGPVFDIGIMRLIFQLLKFKITQTNNFDGK